MSKSTFEGNHAPPKDLLDEETVFSLDDSLYDLPLTPSSRRNDVDSELSLPSNSVGSQSLPGNRRDSRIKAETMLSRVSAYADVSEEIALEQLFEYAWSDEEAADVKDGSTYYVIQELLADFLKVKSFKRRYPDLRRRVCDAYERSWLQEGGLVPPGRAELGLTALLSDEVMNLLQNDFPEVHIEVSDLFRQRRFQNLADQQKRQYEAARIGRGEARAELARKRALESASDFNKQLITERHKERQCYWDLQTMQIHVPQWPYRLLDSPNRKNGAYPIAVIPGQFTENFVSFSPSELNYLPISKALCSQPPHFQRKRPVRQPPPLPSMLRYGNLVGGPHMSSFKNNASPSPANEPSQTNNSALEKSESIATEQPKVAEAAGPPVTDNSKSPQTPARPSRENSNVVESEELKEQPESKSPHCTVCGLPAPNPLQCSQCTRQGHPRCLELPESMVDAVRGYAWSCMECKQCVECEDTGDEDQMMFCDRCDRGYHAYCVGLKGIPDGNWDCPTCDPSSILPPIDKPPTPPPRRAVRRRASVVKRAAASRASLQHLDVGPPTPRKRGRPPKQLHGTAVAAAATTPIPAASK